MQSVAPEWIRQVRELPTWQRYTLIAVMWAVTVVTVSQIHGVVAALLSATTALCLGWLLAKADIDNPRDFLDIHRPALCHIRFALGGVTAVLMVEIGLGLVRALITPASDVASHDIVSTTATKPGAGTVAVLILGAVVVGPFVEELLFRNGIQKLLTPRVGAALSIGLTSAVFTLLHVPSYGGFGAPLGSLALPLTAIFTSSCIFGAVYHRSENVVAAWLSHGSVNALALLVALT